MTPASGAGRVIVVAVDAKPDPLVGQVLLDKLKVIRKLGGGGMGAVYEVDHLITGHRRALKLIKPEYVRRRSFMKRLIREAGVAGKLSTPYVVETYDAGTMDDGSAYVLMELLDGCQLIDVLEREQVLSVERLVGIMVQVCEGVSVAHAAGIIHRDLKPENIFLVTHPSGAERVKILDFGISKFRDNKDGTSRLTQEGTILGTPFYMSPEQAAAREVDERTDVYAVGVMMYEALTGRLPFDAKSVGALFIKIAAGEYLPLRHHRPDVPAEFAAIVDKAMHRDRERRYPTMEALRADIVTYAPGDTKIRAKTISDSPKPTRRTVGYEEVPRPAAVPSSDTLSMGAPRPERCAESQETLALEDSEPPPPLDPAPHEPPPPASAHARRSGRGIWLAAAGILIAATAAAVAIATSGGEPAGGEPAEPPGVAAEAPSERPAPAEPPAEPDRPPEAAEVEAAEPGPETTPAEETAEVEEPRRAIRRPIRTQPSMATPAEQAGLDPNPYGNR